MSDTSEVHFAQRQPRGNPSMMARLRRIPLLAFAPILATFTLMAWVFASPIGAGPDDDFHLVSAWCAGPTADETCEYDVETNAYKVPVALTGIACFAFDPTKSAACQGDDWAWSGNPLIDTNRGNFSGSHPPVFYAVTGALTGGDIQVSALLMRTLTVFLFVAITVALYLLLPAHRRPTLLWAWLLTSVPLGLFLFGTNNPSVWAWIGVGSTWIALLGYYETEGRRKAALGVLFALTALMASGSRADAALYTGFAIALVMMIASTRRRRFFVDSMLPIIVGLMAFALFWASYLNRGGAAGFTGQTYVDPVNGSAADVSAGAAAGTVTGAVAGGPDQALSGFELLALNILNQPVLWSGVLGDWALGWLDTSMPAIVPAATVACFVAICFFGLARMTARKAIAITAVAGVLVALPLYVLQVGGDVVGDQVQPRYFLPLIVLLAGFLLMTTPSRPIVLTLAQRVTVIVALSASQFVALHLNIRRYVTGIDQSGPNLDAGVEWWWQGPIGPNTVWILGSIAYGLLVTILVSHCARISPAPDSQTGSAGKSSADQTNVSAVSP
jgi:hypothetical protein